MERLLETFLQVFRINQSFGFRLYVGVLVICDRTALLATTLQMKGLNIKSK